MLFVANHAFSKKSLVAISWMLYLRNLLFGVIAISVKQLLKMLEQTILSLTRIENLTNPTKDRQGGKRLIFSDFLR